MQASFQKAIKGFWSVFWTHKLCMIMVIYAVCE